MWISSITDRLKFFLVQSPINIPKHLVSNFNSGKPAGIIQLQTKVAGAQTSDYRHPVS